MCFRLGTAAVRESCDHGVCVNPHQVSMEKLVWENRRMWSHWRTFSANLCRPPRLERVVAADTCAPPLRERPRSKRPATKHKSLVHRPSSPSVVTQLIITLRSVRRRIASRPYATGVFLRPARPQAPSRQLVLELTFEDERNWKGLYGHKSGNQRSTTQEVDDTREHH